MAEARNGREWARFGESGCLRWHSDGYGYDEDDVVEGCGKGVCVDAFADAAAGDAVFNGVWQRRRRRRWAVSFRF